MLYKVTSANQQPHGSVDARLVLAWTGHYRGRHALNGINPDDTPYERGFYYRCYCHPEHMPSFNHMLWPDNDVDRRCRSDLVPRRPDLLGRSPYG